MFGFIMMVSVDEIFNSIVLKLRAKSYTQGLLGNFPKRDMIER